MLPPLPSLPLLQDQRTASNGAAGVLRQGLGAAAAACGAEPAAVDVTPKQLKEWLTFPDEWGPTEWGGWVWVGGASRAGVGAIRVGQQS